jgi:hypothetical protein
MFLMPSSPSFDFSSVGAKRDIFVKSIS